jgi:hypothetical protein
MISCEKKTSIKLAQLSRYFYTHMRTHILFFFLSFFPQLFCEVGTTCFSSRCDTDSAIIFTTGCLPDVNPLERVLTTAKAAGTNMLSEARTTHIE